MTPSFIFGVDTSAAKVWEGNTRGAAPAATGIAGFATLQGVDPASPANLLDARTSARSSFARYEFGGVSHSLGSEIYGLIVLEHGFNDFPFLNSGKSFRYIIDRKTVGNEFLTLEITCT